MVTVIPGHERSRPAVNAEAHTWKACWGNPSGVRISYPPPRWLARTSVSRRYQAGSLCTVGSFDGLISPAGDLTYLAPVSSCGLWLGEERLDRWRDDFGLAAAVGRANVGRATVIKAAKYCTPVVREGAGEGVEGGPDEGRSFHVPADQQDVGADVGEGGDGSCRFGDQQRFVA